MANDSCTAVVSVSGALWCRAPCERPSLVEIPVAGFDTPPNFPSVRCDIAHLHGLHYEFVWGDVEADGKIYSLSPLCTG